MSELQSDDLLRFLRTGADDHCTVQEKDDWFNVCNFYNSVSLHHCYSTQINDYQTQPDQRGISIDSDVVLWIDKLAFDGKHVYQELVTFC